MQESYRFFDSAIDDERLYNASHFAEYFNKMFSSGLYRGEDVFAVSADNTTLTLSVTGGSANILGYYYRLDPDPDKPGEMKTFPVSLSATGLYYRLILRLSLVETDRNIALLLVPGTSASPPSVVRNEKTYDLGLAVVYVRPSMNALYQTDINDTRDDPNLCGWVHSTGDPAYYPPSHLPEMLWAFTLFPDTLTEEQRQAVVGNPSLMDMFRKSPAVPQVGDIVTTIRQLHDGQYVPCVGQELDADAYPETVGLQKTPVVFSLTSGAVPAAVSVLLIDGGKGMAGQSGSQANGRLYYTENYGESWVTADTDSYNSAPVPLYLWANGKAIYSRNYYLYHMADFKGKGTETNMYIVDGVCFLPDGHGVVSRGNAPEGLYYTSDYGATWTRSNVTQRGACVIVPNGRGFARTTDGILYTTTNYGVLWSAIGSSADFYNSIVLKNDGHGLCLAGIPLRYTIDYGATWTPCAGLQTSVASRFSLLDDGHGTVVQGSGATAKAYYTSDYGATWTPGFMETLANNETITAVTLAAFGGGFILTSAGTLYTVDFGRSWARLGGITAPNVLLDNGRGIIGGSATCNFKVIAPNIPHGYMKVRSL